jgi:argininosuccinate lyase
MKGLPSGYNKDLQEDKEAVFDAEGTLSASIRATHAVVSRLTLNGDRTGDAASGLLLATDVADYLVARGMPFRKAHEVVGGLVRRLLAEGRDFRTLTLEEWQDASPLFGSDVQRAISASASVEARRTPQSTNPSAVRASLEECRHWLEGLTSQPYATAQGHRPGRQE